MESSVRGDQERAVKIERGEQDVDDQATSRRE